MAQHPRLDGLKSERDGTMAKRHKAVALEMAWGEPEAFRLVVETAVDGERVAALRAATEALKAEAAALQREFEALTRAEFDKIGGEVGA